MFRVRATKEITIVHAIGAEAKHPHFLRVSIDATGTDCPAFPLDRLTAIISDMNGKDMADVPGMAGQRFEHLALKLVEAVGDEGGAVARVLIEVIDKGWAVEWSDHHWGLKGFVGGGSPGFPGPM